MTKVSAHPPIASPLGDVVTDRLVLRRFESSDLEALADVFSAPEVWRFPYGRAFTRNETEAFLESQMAAWEASRFGLWLAIERERNRVIGFVGLSVPKFLPSILPAVEVGWRLHPTAWGKGYASEGARAALREGFLTLELPEICSLPQANNPASSRVCSRIGMRFEREVLIPKDERRGEVSAFLYKMTRHEWHSRD